MCQATKGSNCPFLENNIWCPLTQFDEHPLAYLLMMISHWLMNLKNNSLLMCLKTAHSWLSYWSPTGEFVDTHSLMKMPTGFFVDVVKTFSLTTTVNFIDIFPLCQLKGETIFFKLFLNSPPSYVGVFHFCTPPFNCTRVPSSFLMLAAICVSEVDCKTYTIVLRLTTIPKDQSMHNWSLIWQVGLVCSNSLMNDSSCHNGDKDGDQKTDLLDDRFFDNESILVWLQLQFAYMYVCLQLSHGLLIVFDQENLH